MLVYLRDKLKLNGKTTFSRGELSQLLSVYGRRVQNGEWRDYAIDSTADMAVFSIFRSSRELPIFSVTKTASRSLVRPSQYHVYSGNKLLKQSTSLPGALEFFEENK
jgi:hypothetical protein